MSMPPITSNETLGLKPISSAVSGSRCKNAPPSKEPVEKLTRNMIIFLIWLTLNETVKTPIKENRLTRKTLANA